MWEKFCGLAWSLGVVVLFFRLGMVGVGIAGVVGAIVIYQLCDR